MRKTTKIFNTLVSADDALDMILSKLRSVSGTEIIAVADADLRILSEDIKSSINVPAFDRGAMDGFAVRSADLEEPGMFKIIGESMAGQPFNKTVKKNEAVEIATGAPMPKGADSVVMIEHSTVIGEAVTFKGSVKVGENVGRKAEDIAKGDIVLPRGTVLGPGQIAAAAITGKGKVKVYNRPEVLIFTTGDEVIEPGKPLKAGQVYDSNSYAMMTIARRAGANVKYRPNVKDTPAALKKVLVDGSKKYDLIVFSGGTSVGQRDFAAEVVADAGKIYVHGVAIKPGKPVLFGQIGKCGVFGMPGYPTSCLLTAKLFLAPAIRKLSHNINHERRKKMVKLGHEVKQNKTKQLLLPVNVDDHGIATSTFKGSGAITSLSTSIGYIEIDAGDGVVSKGSEATCRIIR
ncbi:MAG: molybdopterin molybdotransferase MoeA [Planctomycetes bacterium]|nr:molybdopterin molybdotransferase MoeA [Planctomycetota bacterium]